MCLVGNACGLMEYSSQTSSFANHFFHQLNNFCADKLNHQRKVATNLEMICLGSLGCGEGRGWKGVGDTHLKMFFASRHLIRQRALLTAGHLQASYRALYIFLNNSRHDMYNRHTFAPVQQVINSLL